MMTRLPEHKEEYIVRVVYLKRTTGTLSGDEEESLKVIDLKEFAPEHKDLALALFNLVTGVGRITFEGSEMILSAVQSEKDKKDENNVKTISERTNTD